MPDKLNEEELREQAGEPLPPREAMSTLSIDPLPPVPDGADMPVDPPATFHGMK